MALIAGYHYVSIFMLPIGKGVLGYVAQHHLGGVELESCHSDY